MFWLFSIKIHGYLGIFLYIVILKQKYILKRYLKPCSNFSFYSLILVNSMKMTSESAPKQKPVAQLDFEKFSHCKSKKAYFLTYCNCMLEKI